jgi:hypothetical protein
MSAAETQRKEAVMSSSTVRLGLAGLAALTLTGPAVALDEIVGARGWAQVDYAEIGDCRAEVRGNGQFYRIAGQGLQPGEVVRFHLQNADLEPVEYRIAANPNGAWRKFYVPFLWGRQGGTVSVDLESASCDLNLSFQWSRLRP